MTVSEKQAIEDGTQIPFTRSLTAVGELSALVRRE